MCSLPSFFTRWVFKNTRPLCQNSPLPHRGWVVTQAFYALKCLRSASPSEAGRRGERENILKCRKSAKVGLAIAPNSMPLDAHIIDLVTGRIDPEPSAYLGVGKHGILFGHPQM